MNGIRIYIVVVLFFLIGMKYGYAQDSILSLSQRQSVSLQLIGLAFHPLGGTYPQHYHRKLDPKAFFVIELGAGAQYRYRLTKRWSLVGAFAYYSDCALLPAGIVQIGFRWHILVKPRHKFNIGFGPTLLFRRDWHELEDYITDKFFAESVHGKYQYRFYLVPDLEYSFALNNRWDLFFSLVPGGLHVSTSSIGARLHW